MQRLLSRLSHILRKLLGSSRFTWTIIALFVLQALWVAVSFQRHTYDEGFHFGIITIYADYFWPVIYDQPQSYDIYRDFAGEGSKLYHFLLAFPQRLFEVMEFSKVQQIFSHRLINITLVAVGLCFYVKLFDILKVKRVFSNIVLVLTASLPLLVALSASINYDNGLFILTPLFFIYFVRIFSSTKINWSDILILLSVGMAASLVKFIFLPIFFMAVAILAIKKFKLRRDTKSQLRHVQLTKRQLVLLPIIMLLLGLFIQVYVVNFLQYGTPRPSCEQTLGIDRCLRNGVIQRNQKLLAAKEQTAPKNFSSFSSSWFNKMLGNSASTDALYVTPTTKKSLHGKPVPTYKTLMIVGIIIGIFSILYSVWKYRFSNEIIAISLISLTYLGFVFVNNYMLFLKYHVAVAVHSRYGLIVVPIILLLMILSFNYLTKRHRTLQLIVIVVVITLLTQGGGVTPHILQSDERWYRDNQTVVTANEVAKKVLRPLVIEY